MIAPPSPHPQDLTDFGPSIAAAAAATAVDGGIGGVGQADLGEMAVIEDPDGEFTPITMDRGPVPPAPAPPTVINSTNNAGGALSLLPPQSTPPGAALGSGPKDEAKPSYMGPRIINVGVPGPGGRRLMWRRAWRDKILPAVVNFNPDLILVSAGFDAHKKASPISLPPSSSASIFPYRSSI